MRAVRRVAPDRVVQSRVVLDSITLTDGGTQNFEKASRLELALLRTLERSASCHHVRARRRPGRDRHIRRVTGPSRRTNGIPTVAPR